jgi:hypothetical protein
MKQDEGDSLKIEGGEGDNEHRREYLRTPKGIRGVVKVRRKGHQ